MQFTLMICCFFFNDTATTEIYTLCLHDGLPIWLQARLPRHPAQQALALLTLALLSGLAARGSLRSEEHTSELQSLTNLVCRLLLEKKKKTENEVGDPQRHLR